MGDVDPGLRPGGGPQEGTSGRRAWRGGAALGGRGAAATHQGDDGGAGSGAGHDEQVVGHVELGKNRAPGEHCTRKGWASTWSCSSRAAFRRAAPW